MSRHAAVQCYASFMHGAFVIYFLIFLRTKEWCPWYMGGTGEVTKLYKGYPFMQVDKDA